MKTEKKIALYVGEEEYYAPWFACPYCKEEWIISGSKFCNMCGKEIELGPVICKLTNLEEPDTKFPDTKFYVVEK
jgi:hypothetical protein